MPTVLAKKPTNWVDSMCNLVHYIIPGFTPRHLKNFYLLFAVFLAIFIIQEFLYPKKNSVKFSARSPPGFQGGLDDQIVALKAQVGYLRKRLADVSEGKVLDINDHSMPTIYVVTPTYARPVQKAELTRLCQTLLLVPNVHWVLVEDSIKKTDLVTNLLKRCGVPYTHLNALTPPHEKLKDTDPNWIKPRGVNQRNEGLFWLREHARTAFKGSKKPGMKQKTTSGTFRY